ncbi:MAG: hypothetical protein PHD32_11665 [Eubacteriales bacterium]|nr:hypothetical protein [Eubacteriales bacterium]
MRKSTDRVYRKFVHWADKAVDVAIDRVEGQGDADYKMVESALKVMDGAMRGLESGQEKCETGIVLIHQVPRPEDTTECG